VDVVGVDRGGDYFEERVRTDRGGIGVRRVKGPEGEGAEVSH
jgi:hypothetical protein